MTKELFHNQPTILKNQKCAYCGCELNNENTDKEHVIGRRFVPKGETSQQWNLLLNSCRPCNGIKSDLEDDISAITMQQHPFDRQKLSGIHVSEMERKAKSISRKTGKEVRESHETTQIEGAFGPAKFKFGFTALPQIEKIRGFELARYQIAGFFFFLTYDKKLQRGLRWPGSYLPFSIIPSTDWGNPTLTGFAEVAKNWDERLVGATANGYFQVAIKKHPTNELWSWALEWNKSTRVIGWLGDEDAVQNIVYTLPQPDMRRISATERYRAEVPLGEEDSDFLFYRQ